jgi:hypothetical protein
MESDAMPGQAGTVYSLGGAALDEERGLHAYSVEDIQNRSKASLGRGKAGRLAGSPVN